MKSPRPLSIALDEALRRDLAKAPYAPGQFLPGERELTETYGVSRPTLRKALAKLRHEGILQNLPGKGTLLVSRKGKPAGVTLPMALLLPDLTNPFYAALSSALSTRKGPEETPTAIYDYQDRLDQVPGLLEAVRHRGAEPVIYFPGTPVELESLARVLTAPAILIHPFPAMAKSIPFDQVLLDSHGAGRCLAAHLLATGHDRLAFLGLPGQAPERRRGAQAALRESGKPHGALVDIDMHLPGYRGAHEAIGRQAARGLPFNGLIAANDDLALGALSALAALGIAVPRDVAVAGFDDIPAGSLVRPSLTTVRQPVGELCDLIRDLRQARLSDSHEPHHLALPFELIVREST